MSASKDSDDPASHGPAVKTLLTSSRGHGGIRALGHLAESLLPLEEPSNYPCPRGRRRQLGRVDCREL